MKERWSGAAQGTMARDREESKSYDGEEEADMILFCPYEYTMLVYSHMYDEE